MLSKLHYLSYLLVLLWLTGCSQPTPIATPVASIPTPTLMPTPTLTLTPAVSATATIPRETQDFYDMGLVYYLAGAFEEAIASFSQAIALTPDYAQAYLYRGLAYQEEASLNKPKLISNRYLRCQPTRTIWLRPRPACKNWKDGYR